MAADSGQNPKPGDPGTPGWTHRMDQLGAGARDLGGTYAGYFNGMVENGMTREEALQVLTAQVAASNFASSLSSAALAKFRQFGFGGGKGK